MKSYVVSCVRSTDLVLDRAQVYVNERGVLRVTGIKTTVLN